MLAAPYARYVTAYICVCVVISSGIITGKLCHYQWQTEVHNLKRRKIIILVGKRASGILIGSNSDEEETPDGYRHRGSPSRRGSPTNGNVPGIFP